MIIVVSVFHNYSPKHSLEFNGNARQVCIQNLPNDAITSLRNVGVTRLFMCNTQLFKCFLIRGCRYLQGMQTWNFTSVRSKAEFQVQCNLITGNYLTLMCILCQEMKTFSVTL